MRFAATALFISLFLLFDGPDGAAAFYEWGKAENSAEATGFIRLGGSVSKNPSSRLIYPDETDSSMSGIVRLLFLGKIGKRVALDLNIYNITDYNSARGPLAKVQTSGMVERSPALETNYTGDGETTGFAGVDHLNFSFSTQIWSLKLGRQPVNLAASFYFTPNDFFAPFTAQTFFRTYKPGVDAARIEARIGAISHLTVLGVLGYKSDKSTPSGYSQQVSWERSSALLRLSTVLADFEWAALGGKVKKKTVVGGSIQGEIAGWLTLRAEGHHAMPDNSDEESYSEITVELEHRFANSLTIRAAQFHHGSGSGKADQYLRSIMEDRPMSAYLGRAYSAFGAGYELSPLTVIEILGMANWTDNSFLISFYSVFSLADEAELSWGFSIPSGAGTENVEVKSEYGLYPYSANLELRVYF